MQTWAEPATLSSRGTVSTTPSMRCCSPATSSVAEFGQTDVLDGPFTIGEVERDGGGDDARRVVGAAATLTFLATSDDQWIDLRASSFDEHPDALGASELVRTERQQIDVRRDAAQVEPTGRLDGVGVQQRIGSMTPHDARNLGQVGDGPDLVVDRHHTDDRDVGCGIEHGGELVEVDAPDGVDADDATVGSQVFDDVQHGVVLDRWADGDAATSGDRARDRHVVALGPAPGEHDLVGVAPDRPGDRVARFVDGLARSPCEPVRARWVRVHVGEVRHHRLDGLGAHRRRRGVVEIGDGRLRHLGHATDCFGIRPRCDSRHSLGVVRGYDHRSYGEGFADVYDEWYADVTDVDATVTRMTTLAGAGGRVLELGVGTGRLATPMTDAGLRVVGIDSSEAMLAKLRQRDPDGRVEAILGDISEELPVGPFDAVLVAYNTIFNLLGERDQPRLFEHVAERLTPGGAFVVEAFVPHTDATDGSSEVNVRSMASRPRRAVGVGESPG